MEPIDQQDYKELINLTTQAWTKEILSDGITKGRPSMRAISLRMLESKLIRAKGSAMREERELERMMAHADRGEKYEDD